MMSPKDLYPIKIIPTRAERSDCDIAVTYIFGDGSIAALTFSAKGHTFEGVKERFAAHRGNVLISLDDFQRLVIEVVDQKKVITLAHREHGHEAAIRRSYQMTQRENSTPGCDVDYVWGTGRFFLHTKAALDANETIVLEDCAPTLGPGSGPNLTPIERRQSNSALEVSSVSRT